MVYKAREEKRNTRRPEVSAHLGLIVSHKTSLIMFDQVMINLGLFFKHILQGQIFQKPFWKDRIHNNYGGIIIFVKKKCL